VLINRSETLVAWFTKKLGRLYIYLLSYFKRVPKWEELEQLIATQQERFVISYMLMKLLSNDFYVFVAYLEKLNLCQK
jgi:hypothetical protein